MVNAGTGEGQAHLLGGWKPGEEKRRPEGWPQMAVVSSAVRTVHFHWISGKMYPSHGFS